MGESLKMSSLKTYTRIRELLKSNRTGFYTKVDIRDTLKADYNSVKECLVELLSEGKIVKHTKDGVDRYTWRGEE